MSAARFTKQSMVAVGLILGVGAALGWVDHQRLVGLRDQYQQLTVQAAARGITLDPARSHPPGRGSRPELPDRVAEAKQVAANAIAYAAAWAELRQQGGTEAELVTQARFANLGARRRALDPAQVRIFIDEILAATTLDEKTRQSWIASALSLLSEKYPQDALKLLTESTDLIRDNGTRDELVATTLGKWVGIDSAGALAWFRQRQASAPDSIGKDLKLSLTRGIMQQDPRQAFSLIRELGLEDQRDLLRFISVSVKSTEQRHAALAALREHCGLMQDESKRESAAIDGIEALTHNAAFNGFESATEWFEKAKFSPDELERAAEQIADFAKDKNTGQWIEWAAQHLPPDLATPRIGDMVGFWARVDHAAAAKWLDESPPGPTKNVAVRSFAETVSAYEPQTAAQWALTLPPGEDRDATLRTIHRNWKKLDPAASAAFAKEHGLGDD